MTRRRAVVAALAGVAAVPLAGRPVHADDIALRVAGVPFDQTAVPYYALELGNFKKAGLAVTLDTFSANGAVIASAVLAGAMDIGVSNIPSLATAHGKGVPFVLIAPAGLYVSTAPVDTLMVPLASTVRTARDLEGKTMAVNGLGNIAQFGPEAWIDQNGGDAKKVRYVEMGPAESLAALAQNRIDASLVAEPFITAGKKVARVLANCFDAIAPRFMISAYFTTLDWARAHGDAVRRFAEAMRETALWANQNHERTLTMLAAFSKMSPETIRATTRVTYADRLDPVLIQPVVDVAAKYGGLRSFPAADLIYRG